MNIRPYTSADRQACLDVLASNTPEYFVPSDRGELISFLDDLPGPYFVVEEGDEMFACGGWALDPDGVAVLTWGMVRRDRHRRTIGTLLLRHRLDDIRRDGRAARVRIRTVQLVQGFYARHGFDVIDVVPDGCGPGLDRVTMERPVGGDAVRRSA